MKARNENHRTDHGLESSVNHHEDRVLRRRVTFLAVSVVVLAVLFVFTTAYLVTKLAHVSARVNECACLRTAQPDNDNLLPSGEKEGKLGTSTVIESGRGGPTEGHRQPAATIESVRLAIMRDSLSLFSARQSFNTVASYARKCCFCRSRTRLHAVCA